MFSTWHTQCGQNHVHAIWGTKTITSTAESGVLPLLVQVWMATAGAKYGDSGPQRHFYLLGKWAYSYSNANTFTSLSEVPACLQDQGFYQGLGISGFNNTVQTRYTQTHGFHEWQYMEEHFFRTSHHLPFPALLSQSLSHLHKSSWESQEQ